MTKMETADEFLAKGKQKNNALIAENAKLNAQLASMNDLCEDKNEKIIALRESLTEARRILTELLEVQLDEPMGTYEEIAKFLEATK